LESVSKSYSGREIIKKASLRLSEGRALILTGPSGAGKSTLLEIMAGVAEPDSGLVERSGKAALMFQDDALVPWLTAMGNLLFASSSGPRESFREAERLLAYFDLPQGAYPAAMSGGMRRRLNLARALMAKRPIVLLDEPFAFLDEAWKEKVAGLIAQELSRGAAVALATHGGEEALESLLKGGFASVSVEGSPVVIDAG
jgi:ABC-type nitrate/sulfonate/bicarbonate transport system ATPase subunit